MTATAEGEPPPALLRQLAPGAALVCPVDRGGRERLVRFREDEEETVCRSEIRAPPTRSGAVIREFSAGGVVVRRFRGRPFVAVVRVRDDVLALPKGHPDGDESSVEAARREVREEAGVEAEAVEKLGDVRYWYWRDGERVLKIVSFFLFRWRSGSVRNHDREVEEARWIPLEEAPERLRYKGEREMAAAALSRLGPGR